MKYLLFLSTFIFSLSAYSNEIKIDFDGAKIYAGRFVDEKSYTYFENYVTNEIASLCPGVEYPQLFTKNDDFQSDDYAIWNDFSVVTASGKVLFNIRVELRDDVQGYYVSAFQLFRVVSCQ